MWLFLQHPGYCFYLFFISVYYRLFHSLHFCIILFYVIVRCLRLGNLSSMTQFHPPRVIFLALSLEIPTAGLRAVFPGRPV